RNSFGGLLLLPKSFNAAFGALPYADKVVHYYGQETTLAKSLHPACYKYYPGFRRVIEHFELPFKPYESVFDERAIAERQALYAGLCELGWAPAAYGLVVPSAAQRPATTERTRVHYGITVAKLVEAGYIEREARLVGGLRDTEYHAQLTPDG